MAYDYLADLNPEQRRAVKHGVRDGSATDSKPLLVIAGAGTGKTKTLAHRVAHLIVNGVDPHRILLLTFSRRAAVEMTGRVKRITAAALGTGHVDLAWAGTFHAVGARLLREYAHRIGLQPSFTIRRAEGSGRGLARLCQAVCPDTQSQGRVARRIRARPALVRVAFAANL